MTKVGVIVEQYGKEKIVINIMTIRVKVEQPTTQF